MTVQMVISGGQTGVDQAALRAAKTSDLVTGGWVPKGCRTEDGNNPDLVTLYGCWEHESRDWPPRTRKNVEVSNGTLWLRMHDDDTPGYRCTKTAVKSFSRPWLEIAPSLVGADRTVLAWIEANQIKVLNVAGSRESKAPGIGVEAERFLIDVFTLARMWDLQFELRARHATVKSA
jgi:hypothetical protein